MSDFDVFYRQLSRIAQLNSISNLLGWDQQVSMPEGAAPYRGEQLAFVSEAMHQAYLEKDFTSAVSRLVEQDLDEPHATNVREINREIQKKKKLPPEFVAKKAKLSADSFSAWEKARPSNDFPAVQQFLEQLVEFAKQESDLLGYEESPYDPHIDAFEAYSTSKEVKAALLPLASELKILLPEATAATESVKHLQGDFPLEQQEQLNRRILEGIGYDFHFGRVDKVSHPFMSRPGRNDVRVTTRYQEHDFLSSLLTLLHEAGHALYELGFLPEHYGTPMGDSVSMAIHESQSLYWENFIGRSLPFCKYLFTFLPENFKAQVDDEIHLHKLLNKVQPSLIRVEADRVSYPLHIVIRMTLEEQLLQSELQVKDLPEAWNALYKEYLGISPADDRTGILQDVHWYSGFFGYFPSYALGQVYAALFHEKLLSEIKDFDDLVEAGNFTSILEWLRKNIHQHGMRYKATELVQRVCGKELNHEPLVAYLSSSFL